ncbi:lytic transglycosylase domain-containing protein [Blastococcus sp. CT_GayMR16]|uniref:lytic transglycosylase domain-containing protein n=1 Tax=Blastococcus sp. CT_GayMR16 TaxID=2559607 RepID=UPI001ADD82EA|nr:lytic transglycosylase domain-containing protein [Blastococcus sp. CT_GayMR16]
MVQIDHPQPQDVSPDGAPSPEGKKRGRHAVPAAQASAHRFHRRRRWPVIAAVAALAALVVPPPGPTDPVLAAEVSDASLPTGLTSAGTISFLSSGAPTGSIVLASAPAQTGDQQPIAPTVISGLAANGIPNVALNAYRVAAARMASAEPSCGIDWSLLAGIGRVETNHARFRGAVLNSDGTSTPRIMGPPLDGVQFAFIRDTDGGSWDGDATFDRAVGPMQFIPATWRAYGIDGDGNGTADPFNINDAALGAANYLCASGGNLRTDAGQRKAVMAYNHSDSYVNEVLALARAYASGIPVADIPLVGNTTGAIPAPGPFTSSGGGPTYYGGPANPGPAIGAGDMTPASGPTTGQNASGGAPAGSGAPADSGAAGGPAAPAGDGGGGTTPGSTPPAGPAPAGHAPGPNPGPSSGPAPAAPAIPAPVPPAPVPPLPVPVPPAPVPPAPVPPAPVPGVTCTTLNGLGLPVIPALPVCP